VSRRARQEESLILAVIAVYFVIAERLGIEFPLQDESSLILKRHLVVAKKIIKELIYLLIKQIKVL
jgi:hypothetical protein